MQGYFASCGTTGVPNRYAGMVTNIDMCAGNHCRQEGENLYAGVLLCDDCRGKMMSLTGGSWSNSNTQHIAVLASILKRSEKASVIERYGKIPALNNPTGKTTMVRKKKETTKTATATKDRAPVKKKRRRSLAAKPSADAVVEGLVEPAELPGGDPKPKKKAKNGRRKKTATKEKVTKAKVTKTAAKAPAKKKKTKKDGEIRRRESNPLDDVAGRLLEFDTVDRMITYAKKVKGINKEKLAKAREDHAGGVQVGLIRMRIGNMIRGAMRRAAAGR